MTPHNNNNTNDDPITSSDCNERHRAIAVNTRWIIGIVSVVMISIAGSVTAFVISTVSRSAEHEIRLQHLESSMQKLDRMADNMTEIRRILEDFKKK